MLKKVLRKGFKAYPIYQKESDTLIARIEEALQGDNSRFQQLIRQRISITEDYLEQLLPLTSGIREGNSTTTETPLWQQKIASLKVGEWITDKQHQGQVRVLNLAWRSPDVDRFGNRQHRPPHTITIPVDLSVSLPKDYYIQCKDSLHHATET
ncbi:MAG: DUF1631 domain-containing protein [Gammaproteobacteria bacterium]|nr:DUF1631 domain-containing protein [Gammaproteobacteria bacterium]